jgi:hypothetical protein
LKHEGDLPHCRARYGRKLGNHSDAWPEKC